MSLRFFALKFLFLDFLVVLLGLSQHLFLTLLELLFLQFLVRGNQVANQTLILLVFDVLSEQDTDSRLQQIVALADIHQAKILDESYQLTGAGVRKTVDLVPQANQTEAEMLWANDEPKTACQRIHVLLDSDFGEGHLFEPVVKLRAFGYIEVLAEFCPIWQNFYPKTDQPVLRTDEQGFQFFRDFTICVLRKLHPQGRLHVAEYPTRHRVELLYLKPNRWIHPYFAVLARWLQRYPQKVSVTEVLAYLDEFGLIFHEFTCHRQCV